MAVHPQYSLTVLPSDYNYELQNDRTCALVSGLEPQDHAQACRDDPDLKSYFKPYGYRKIPISTCSGGAEHKFLGEEVACPGHEREVEEEHRGLSGFAFFLVAILLPFTAAGLIGFVVYRRFQGSFGRIRLDDASSGSIFDADKPWVQWPVAAISALIAVLAAVPMVIGAGWRWTSSKLGRSRAGRYTTRQSFARGRGDYAAVDNDEDELLGDEEEDEA